GWRVAYHLARSVKTRRLELPATLPLCLYPPGVTPDVQREEKARAESLRGEGEEYDALAAGGLDGHSTAKDAEKGQGMGSALVAVKGSAAQSTGGRKRSNKQTKNKKQTKKNNGTDGKEEDGGTGSNAAAVRASSVGGGKRSKENRMDKSASDAAAVVAATA
ncbi:unnamed protein product, partial [Laminaria digitata]